MKKSDFFTSLFMSKLKRIQKNLPYLYVMAGLLSFASSFIISVEKLKLLADPSYIPPCSINPVIGCGAVMQSPQAAVFGFPNPWLGLIGFAIIVTIGMAMLAGAQFKRWFWIGTQLGMLFGVGFIYWLFYQAVYVINSLCLYCMVVWALMIPLFLYTVIYNLRERHLRLGRKETLSEWVIHHSTWLLLGMYLVIVLGILTHFWDYWVTLF